MASSEDADVDRATFEYMLKKDVPSLVDAICKHLMKDKPADPVFSTIQFLQARRGGYHGGVAVASQNVGGGWLRIVDGRGNMLGQLDRLPFDAEGGIQLMASAPRDASLYIVCVTREDGSSITGSIASIPPEQRCHEIRRYGFDGKLLFAMPAAKPVSCITTDRERGHLWVMYRSGGGTVYQANGTKLRDLSTPPTSSVLIDDKVYWLLTQRSIERRDFESGQLDLAVHLPDSMSRPSSFALSKKHVIVAAPNVDGSTNFVGVFEADTCRPATYFVPQPGSVIAPDRLRGGVWQVPPRGNSYPLSFTNEKGSRVISQDLGRVRQLNIVVDQGSGLLWAVKVEDDYSAALVPYDPLKCIYGMDVSLPEVSAPTTHMIQL